jgi:hypothetical protein
MPPCCLTRIDLPRKSQRIRSSTSQIASCVHIVDLSANVAFRDEDLVGSILQQRAVLRPDLPTPEDRMLCGKL